MKHTAIVYAFGMLLFPILQMFWTWLHWEYEIVPTLVFFALTVTNCFLTMWYACLYLNEV